jgi:hypothetical protein
MKKLIIISILALFTLNSFSQTILKKIDIDIPAIEQTARVAEITFIAKDQSYIKVNLFLFGKRSATETGDIDGETSLAYGKWQGATLLAKDRTFNKADAVKLFGLDQADYETFYPPVIVLTEEEKKALKIAELEKVIESATKELNELKG